MSSRPCSHAAASHRLPTNTSPRPSEASESQELHSERNHRPLEEGCLLQAQAVDEGRGRVAEAGRVAEGRVAEERTAEAQPLASQARAEAAEGLLLPLGRPAQA